VVDLARRRLTVRNTLAKGAHSDYVTLVHQGARTDLVRVEAVEQPATKCPAAAGSCFAWQVTAEQLPSGSARVIARSRAPAASTDVPQPVSNGSVVAWLDVAVHGRAQVIRWHPGSAPRPLGPPVATGLLSLGATDAWVGTPFGQAVLTRLPLDGRAPSRVELPPGAALATVGDSLVAYRVDRADGTRSVCVAAVERAVSCRVVFRAPDIYLLGWLGGDLLVSSPAGYGLVDPRTASTTPTTLNYLYLVHDLAGRIAVLLDAGDHQVLAVGRSPA
jgi:hypothetical protein